MQVKNLNFAWGEKPILNSFSIDFMPGHVHTIFGRNGCGKSTFLRLLSGLTTPASSKSVCSIKVDGAVREIDSRTWESQMLRLATYVFQSTKDIIIPYQTRKMALNYGVTRRKETDQASEYKDWIISNFPSWLLDNDTKYWGKCSGGQMQALQLARALMINPVLLLLDEPFSAIDTLARQSLEQAICRIQSSDSQRYCILVTHDIDCAVFMSNSVTIVDGPPLKIIKTISIEESLATRDANFRNSKLFVDKRSELFDEFQSVLKY